MVQKTPHFLTTSFNNKSYPTQQQIIHDYDEEFNECDVVWSSSFDDFPPTTTTTATTPTTASVTSTTAGTGLSAALLSNTDPPQSPSSIQRKTTSSPVSMISSSLTRSDGGPGLTGYYYGRRYHQSAPVNVPVWPNGLGSNAKSRPFIGLGRFDEADDEGFDDGDDDEMVPPHEIVARSHRATSFSVMEGAGRTLKGRDLTRVRNAVFQKTGFLE